MRFNVATQSFETPVPMPNTTALGGASTRPPAAPNGDPWYTMMAANKLATLQLR